MGGRNTSSYRGCRGSGGLPDQSITDYRLMRRRDAARGQFSEPFGICRCRERLFDERFQVNYEHIP